MFQDSNDSDSCYTLKVYATVLHTLHVISKLNNFLLYISDPKFLEQFQFHNI